MTKEKYSYGRGFVQAFRSEKDGKRVYMDLRQNHPEFIKREKFFTYNRVKDLPKRKQAMRAQAIGREHGEMFENEVEISKDKVTYSPRAVKWLTAKPNIRQLNLENQKTVEKQASKAKQSDRIATPVSVNPVMMSKQNDRIATPVSVNPVMMSELQQLSNMLDKKQEDVDKAVDVTDKIPVYTDEIGDNPVDFSKEKPEKESVPVEHKVNRKDREAQGNPEIMNDSPDF